MHLHSALCTAYSRYKTIAKLPTRQAPGFTTRITWNEKLTDQLIWRPRGKRNGICSWFISDAGNNSSAKLPSEIYWANMYSHHVEFLKIYYTNNEEALRDKNLYIVQLRGGLRYAFSG